ncbi:DUF2968 domain-containing protein [Orrella sp. JC864]|uniref:DUF2968 domain-containing protein n=1 Tax=Orrella sp. JC864 TaxID=3120298 RepID=UPI00300B0CB2
MKNRRVQQLAARGLLAGLFMAGLSACAMLQSEAERPVVAQTEAPQTPEAAAQPVTPPAGATPPVAPPPAALGPTAEVQHLIQSRQVNELRTTYNGSYGASLLFKPDELVYYVALFRQKEFLRVSKTDSASEADQIYRRFVAQTAELAEVDIRRIKLQAERARTERLLSDRSSELDALEADLSRQRQQAAQVAAAQRQAEEEASQLAAQQKEAAAELRRLQERIKVLERQAATVGQPEARKAGAPRAAPRQRAASPVSEK